MLNTVKDLLSTVGDTTGSFAKSVGTTSTDLAKTIGNGTVELARTIGPKRALIGAVVIVAAVGGSIMLVRYLRRREQSRLDAESMRASDEAIGRGVSVTERRAAPTPTTSH